MPNNVGVGCDECGGAKILESKWWFSFDYADGTFRNQLPSFQICKCDDIVVANSASVNIKQFAGLQFFH